MKDPGALGVASPDAAPSLFPDEVANTDAVVRATLLEEQLSEIGAALNLGRYRSIHIYIYMYEYVYMFTYISIYHS